MWHTNKVSLVCGFGRYDVLIIIIIIIIINDSVYPAVSKASRTGNKVSCQPNDCPNRWVFKRRLKMASDGAETMSAGRSLHGPTNSAINWSRFSGVSYGTLFHSRHCVER